MLLTLVSWGSLIIAAALAAGIFLTLRDRNSTPLRALWQHPPYFHDGTAKTLADVVTHYDTVLKLKLNDPAQRDLIEYLKSL